MHGQLCAECNKVIAAERAEEAAERIAEKTRHDS